MKPNLCVISIACLVAFQLQLQLPAQPAGQPWVRRNVYSAEAAANVASYAKGVAVMKEWSKTKPADVRGWTYQANMHGFLPQDLEPGKKADDLLWGGCQHGSYFFLSWHRMYLHYFERIVREASGDQSFALPYWGYSNDAAAERYLPPAFRVPATADNALYVPDNAINADPAKTIRGRDPRINHPTKPLALDPATTTAKNALDNVFFSPPNPWTASFAGGANTGGLLEGVPHGTVHVAVAGGIGLMGSFSTAGRDPIFWLHHANVDRLWEVWLRQKNGRENPAASTAWAKKAFTFFDEKGNKKTLTGRQVVDTAQMLKYQYDAPVLLASNSNDGPGGGAAAPGTGAPAVATGTAATAPAETATLAASETGAISLGGKPKMLSIPLTEANSEKIRATLPGPGPMAAGERAKLPVILLRLEGIKFDKLPEGDYKVFLNLSPEELAKRVEGRGPPLEEDPHYVDIIPFFTLQKHEPPVADAPNAAGHDHHGTGKDKGASKDFDITHKVAALDQLGRWKDDKFEVSFIQSAPVDADGRPVYVTTTDQCQIGQVKIVKITPP